jgi:hypothetical protein
MQRQSKICGAHVGDAVEEVGVEPAELRALARGAGLDDGVEVLLQVGRAGAELRLQLPPRAGVDEPLHPQQVPRVRPDHRLGLLAGLLRHGDPQVELAGAARRRGSQQLERRRRQERRARDRREPSPAYGAAAWWRRHGLCGREARGQRLDGEPERHCGGRAARGPDLVSQPGVRSGCQIVFRITNTASIQTRMFTDQQIFDLLGRDPTSHEDQVGPIMSFDGTVHCHGWL